tara:strand:- start:230 stop:403 length:174 start_codon:yes stop_codon:yes gene_type:complete
MKKINKTKRLQVRHLNPIQKQYLKDVAFLQTLSKTGFGQVPENLFDNLYKKHYEKNK